MDGFNNRQQAIEAFADMLDGLTRDVGGKKPKGILTRKWFVNYIKNGNRMFDNEEDEYRYVGKWGRSHWDMVMQKGKLTAEEKNQLQLFAELFGAMDY